MDTKINPVTVEILRNAFFSIANDMNAALMRSAYSPIIYEGADCAVALLDKHGDVLGQSVGVALFLANLEVCVKYTAERFGWDYFKSGDIIYMNDSYITGGHLNDATIISPIYWRDELVGFSASRAHWIDVGGKDPGQTTDSIDNYQEGVRWGPTKIYVDAKPREEFIDLIRRNSRYGNSIIGDLNAQVAAARTGETRFQTLFDRFGYDTVVNSKSEIFRQSEELERSVVKSIPDGTYFAEGYLDDDGRGNGPVPVSVKIDKKTDHMVVDMTGSSPMTEGPINSGFAQTVSGIRMAFKLLVNPERPVDGGTFRTLDVIAPEGTIFNAQDPAPCQYFFTPMGILSDLFVKALAPVLPDRVAAAHYGDSMVTYFVGKDPRKNLVEYLAVEPNTGGWGAWDGEDGQDALINNVNGAFKDLPVEIYENKYPIQIRKYGIRKDTGGPGRFRGGCGVFRQYYMTEPTSVYLWFERSVTPAWGLFGGQKAVGPDVVINQGCPDEKHMLKVNGLKLNPGDTVTYYTGGGGGYGDPLERSPELVLDDVKEGYVSIQKAESDYGVVVKNDLSIDEIFTRKLRRKEK